MPDQTMPNQTRTDSLFDIEIRHTAGRASLRACPTTIAMICGRTNPNRLSEPNSFIGVQTHVLPMLP